MCAALGLRATALLQAGDGGVSHDWAFLGVGAAMLSRCVTSTRHPWVHLTAVRTWLQRGVCAGHGDLSLASEARALWTSCMCHASVVVQRALKSTKVHFS